MAEVREDGVDGRHGRKIHQRVSLSQSGAAASLARETLSKLSESAPERGGGVPFRERRCASSDTFPPP
ncbi:hypothetical protein GCM10010191_37470 [Actinomadura vinacea]|uniref:Uncharacterized protein n=1 Tax=Actinomadura vinacea TaxID=115336 RepID=A0ABN3J6S0_9ACTN